jgi:superfamily I DNA/RNA helicase
MSIIQEYKRDDSKDYLFVLKSLNEIPFPVGKNLLVDFLKGDIDNSSVEKNKLFDLYNFGCLEFLEKRKILEIIESLIINGMIDVGGSVFNKFAKVLSINIKGKNELIEPTLNSKKVSEKYEEIETTISDLEIQAFKELGDFLKNFNQEQKKAIVSPKEKILCIAGAGSGKTTVLTKRIEFLNKMKKVRGDEILAITFTRKAREEMQKRLEELGVKVVVETFNSFCEKILLKNGGRVYGKKVRVASYQDKMFAILRALDNQGLNIEQAIDKYFSINQKRNRTAYQLQNLFMNDCFSVFEYFKITRKPLDEFRFERDYANSKMIFEIVKFLDKHMVVNGLRTYADQINDVLNFFKIHQKYIPKFQHILVDEFQDVNSNQVELLDLLNSKNLFCVGDPRQSIFGWRGSDVNYILDFQNKYSEAEIINLKKNYRSNKHIVELMNHSIKVMKMPDLEPDFIYEKEIKLENFSGEEEEFNFVLEKLLSVEIPFEEIFVLARTNRQLSDFAELLKKKGIKFILKNDDKKDEEIKKGHVTLSTIHSIKGLEAEMVFVIGCTKNNFPCKSSDHPVIENLKLYEYDKEEEERRLFYVAISRAKNKLYLSYSGKGHTYFINDEMKGIID